PLPGFYVWILGLSKFYISCCTKPQFAEADN
ncbi:MAG: hypothetical protein ACI8PD_002310, partial [Nitrospinales bacterium]